MICSPQFVGGADASQNGLRHGIPQNVVSSVGLGTGMFSLQPRGNTDSGTLPIGYRIHHFAASVCAITAGKEIRIRCLACNAVDDDPSAFKFHLRSAALGLR